MRFLMLLLLALAAPASAAQIDLSLNLLYDAPFNPNSGGVWQVVAKSDGDGIRWLSFGLTGNRLASSQFVAPQGVVNGDEKAGFVKSVVKFTSPGVYTDYLATINTETTGEVGRFYGVGVIAGGSPGDLGPQYTSLTNLSHTPWATGDALGDASWQTAAMFFTGTFAPGDAPLLFFDNGASPILPRGSVYHSVSTATTTTAAPSSASATTPVTTLVRNNLQGVAGDYNQDGQVDAADYSVWRAALGESVAVRGTGADGDADGLVTTADYQLWRRQFGEQFPVNSAASQAIPSPGALAWCVAMPFFAALRGRRDCFSSSFGVH